MALLKNLFFHSKTAIFCESQNESVFCTTKGVVVGVGSIDDERGGEGGGGDDEDLLPSRALLLKEASVLDQKIMCSCFNISKFSFKGGFIK